MVADFYFQLLSGTFLFLITSFLAWMSYNTWRMTIKVSTFETEVRSIFIDLTSIAEDVKALRKYDAQIAVLIEGHSNIKAEMMDVFIRIRDLEKAA